MLLAGAVPASAGLIYDSSVLLSAQGFGTAPRDLTVQRTGNTTSPESGCVSPTGGFTVGSSACMGRDAAFMPNGVINIGGDEPSPTTDNQKYGAPFASDRNITTASNIGILFNATEPGGDEISVSDLTLKFYLGNTLVGSIDGQQTFTSSNPGNGVAGFVFRVDQAQTAYVNSLLALGNIQFALESTLINSSGGPESFRIVNLGGGGSSGGGGATVPEPVSLVLFGMGALAFARRTRRAV
ncbi:MAG: PEP-CTERM sorting domain-containing protein [Vicinamibacterales bacterium]